MIEDEEREREIMISDFINKTLEEDVIKNES